MEEKLKVAEHLAEQSFKALLGSCSQCIFITEQLLKIIGVPEEGTSLSIKTMNGEASHKSNVIEGLEVSNSKDSFKWIKLPKAYSRDELLVNEADIIIPEKLKVEPFNTDCFRSHKDWKGTNRFVNKSKLL